MLFFVKSGSKKCIFFYKSGSNKSAAPQTVNLKFFCIFAKYELV